MHNETSSLSFLHHICHNCSKKYNVVYEFIILYSWMVNNHELKCDSNHLRLSDSSVNHQHNKLYIRKQQEFNLRFLFNNSIKELLCCAIWQNKISKIEEKRFNNGKICKIFRYLTSHRNRAYGSEYLSYHVALGEMYQ